MEHMSTGRIHQSRSTRLSLQASHTNRTLSLNERQGLGRLGVVVLLGAQGLRQEKPGVQSRGLEVQEQDLKGY